MTPALLMFFGFCAALFCWAWEKIVDENEYDD